MLACAIRLEPGPYDFFMSVGSPGIRQSRAPERIDAKIACRIGTAAHHEVTAAVAGRDITRQGFETIVRDDRFIDRSVDDDVWWLMVFRRP